MCDYYVTKVGGATLTTTTKGLTQKIHEMYQVRVTRFTYKRQLINQAKRT